ncbi:MAG: gas vesicle protein GvpFL, partial [Actinophytocola sp.]|nr:gas vesicle protein GvpFL [Actinophytocola sp.]
MTVADVTAEPSAARYVYGVVRADAALPAALSGLGPSGEVTTVRHGELRALVGEVP